MRSTGPLAALAATAMVFVLAGCTGTPGDDGLTYEDSPLNKYVAAAWGGDLSPEEQQKQSEENQRKVEELVAECMADEGFEYTPNTDNGGMFASADGDWEPEKREWVEKYGYGMVNSPFNERQEEEPAEEYVDPNQDYVQTLSETEQTAFYETLYGASPDEDELNEDGSYEYRWEDGGCQGWAQHEIDGDDVWQSDEFSEIRTKMEEFWTTTQEAPELADLNAEWAKCMADGGEPGFTKQADASQSIVDEQNALYDAAYGDGSEPVDTESPEFVEPSDSPEMKKLGEREIELALVDLDCRKKTSYMEESLKIQFALEEKFIAENKAELDAFKAAAEQSK
ncbi:hypothetical protein SRABI76_01244 [Microbacterium oxydans]|uniref:Lipoprotein n=1 Tax=Microbacterium oxydans TaxID=82380 RepID=A0A0F0L7H0_9MICO|nr:hypothetical protein [Microbacterium oxydans]KJL27486.1 hypothetical protein RS83_02532 [Microbacterium oxydans]CAH0169516.1 hypothetical protein SRABI76_01244 [Microbacterium oxydans]